MKLRFFMIFLMLAGLTFAQNVERNSYVLLPDSTEKFVQIPTQEFAREWADLEFDDSDWIRSSGAPGGIGYETETGYEDWISLDVRDSMFGPVGEKYPTCLLRIKFNMTDEQVFNVWKLYLHVRYDDGFVALLNTLPAGKANAPRRAGSSRSWSYTAPESHEAEDWELFDMSILKSHLISGQNILAIQAFNDTTTSPDFFINAKISVDEFPVVQVSESNLPLVFIDTDFKPIPGQHKIDAHMGIIYHGVGKVHRRDEPINDYDGKIGIEVRGNSSTTYPKRQFAVETRRQDGSNNNVSLMGLPTENDWVLHAPYIDKTFLRNVLTYDLARRMGRYASRTRYCELFINDNYVGLYVLMEKPKRDNDRIDIAKMDSTATDGDAVTGGYIIKLDKAGNDGFLSAFSALNGKDIFYQYHEPQDDKITVPQKNYIQQYMTAFESLMAGEHYADPDSGYPRWIDVDSFVDYFLINEFSKNVDAYRLSTFLYKDRDSVDPRLNMGPVWDYNIAYGAAHYYSGAQTEGWVLDVLVDSTQTPFWWKKLRQDPHFTRRIRDRWFELRDDTFSIDRIYAFIDNVSDTLAQARERNFLLWSAPGEACEGFWPAPDTLKNLATFEDEITYLKSWISNRIAWIDDNVMQFTEVSEHNQPSQPLVFALYQNFPNPFNSSTTLHFELESPADVALDIFNSRGQLIRAFMQQNLPAGEHRIVWDGRDETRQPVAGGLYFYRLHVRSGQKSFTHSRKMLLLK